ncbi:hypothetical protein BKA70DRAFT_1479671 [Coprinopsis sp. MPI-PUGE-AT-0042]|nr:hypothetical protein BKA70DRAFT_1479671 [Coprinopsis sp. MPI-PUGE-AT-0042]
MAATRLVLPLLKLRLNPTTRVFKFTPAGGSSGDLTEKASWESDFGFSVDLNIQGPIMTGRDLSSYARCNDPMPEYLKPAVLLELDKLHRQVSSHVRQIVNLDHQLGNIASQIEALRHKLSTLSQIRTTLITTYTGLVTKQIALRCCKAPIRRVPPEIIAEVIFFATRCEDGTMGRDERLTFMSMRSVCKLWRETSFSTPALWQDLSIEDSGLGHDSETISKRLSSWLRYCKNVDWMDISIDTTRAPYHTQIISALSASQFPVTGLYLHGHAEFGTVTLLADLPQPMQAMKQLSLLVSPHRDNGRNSQNTPFLALTSSLPTLTHLALRSGSQYNPIDFALGHRSVQTLDLENIGLTLYSFHLLLENLPSLKELWALRVIIQHSSQEDESSSLIAQLTHQSLEHLSFGGVIPTRLLSSLVCPAIRILRVGATQETDIPPDTEANVANTITEFVRRSNPTSIYIALRRGVTTNFIQSLFTGFHTIPSILKVRVCAIRAAADRRWCPSGLPNVFTHASGSSECVRQRVLRVVDIIGTR